VGAHILEGLLGLDVVQGATALNQLLLKVVRDVLQTLDLKLEVGDELLHSLTGAARGFLLNDWFYRHGGGRCFADHCTYNQSSTIYSPFLICS
jgi:hypothetical protein